MGIVGNILGMGRTAGQIGEAVGGVAEVFVGNRANRELYDQQQLTGAVTQFGQEFASAGGGFFDRAVNGLNRLPRPLLALGTIGMFVYAMTEPTGFALRMEGLAIVPEPLWWLLGAIVSFYFGARELHHQRSRGGVTTAQVRVSQPPSPDSTSPMPLFGFGRKTEKTTVPAEARPTLIAVRAEDPDFNAAIEEWHLSKDQAA